MLETEGVLRTWRLSEPPTPDHPVEAEPIGDHRLMYLDYEGEVSGGRGKVKRIDSGKLVWNQSSPNQISVSISGGQYSGVFVIENRELRYQKC